MSRARYEAYPAEPEKGRAGASRRASVNENSLPETANLIERVVDATNLQAALQRVIYNRGSPGVDGMTVYELEDCLRHEWPHIKERLLNGDYLPKPVLKVEIPKENGGVRMLGIPTVLDRLIQQMLHQVLRPVFEKEFSEYSFGFRLGKSAHQAVLKAREYQHAGKRWVVDIDLKQFFDEVNHDVLMSLVARKVGDKRVLRLIRLYLRSGIMAGGVISQRIKGTPQGGPLSPLLSNILLNQLDMELERRGHRFCRYADDCNIYVGSRKSGERTLASVSLFIEKKLRLKINRDKSAVARPWKRKFLGFSFTMRKKCKIRAAPKSLTKFKKRT